MKNRYFIYFRLKNGPLILSENPNESEIYELKEFLDKRSFINENGCKFWEGGLTETNTGWLVPLLIVKRIRFAAHRLMFYVSLDGKTCLDPIMYLFHICHKHCALII